jgi:hypothetical protein
LGWPKNAVVDWLRAQILRLTRQRSRWRDTLWRLRPWFPLLFASSAVAIFGVALLRADPTPWAAHVLGLTPEGGEQLGAALMGGLVVALPVMAFERILEGRLKEQEERRSAMGAELAQREQQNLTYVLTNLLTWEFRALMLELNTATQGRPTTESEEDPIFIEMAVQQAGFRLAELAEDEPPPLGPALIAAKCVLSYSDKLERRGGLLLPFLLGRAPYRLVGEILLQLDRVAAARQYLIGSIGEPEQAREALKQASVIFMGHARVLGALRMSRWLVHT